jgi:hypothetical protein
MCGFGDWAIAGPHGLVCVVVVERLVVMYGRTDLNAHATAPRYSGCVRCLLRESSEPDVHELAGDLVADPAQMAPTSSEKR